MGSILQPANNGRLRNGLYHKQAPDNLVRVNGEMFRIPAKHTQVFIEVAGDRVFLVNMRTGLRECELAKESSGTARIQL